MNAEQQSVWDQFAAAAVTGLIHDGQVGYGPTSATSVAENAARIADALMTQRKERIDAAKASKPKTEWTVHTGG